MFATRPQPTNASIFNKQATSATEPAPVVAGARPGDAGYMVRFGRSAALGVSWNYPPAFMMSGECGLHLGIGRKCLQT